MKIKLMADEEKKSMIWQTKEDSYANDLVKTQLWASFHMRADTRRTGYQYFRAGIIHESIMASNKRNQRRGSISITVSIMLPREVSICNFFQLNVEKSDPRSLI